MVDKNKNFGTPFFTPRERKLLKLMRLEQVLGERWLRFRYRDRIRFGRGCRVDYRSVTVNGPGTVAIGDEVVIERGIHRALFHLEPESRVVLGRGAWIQTFDSSVVFSCKAGAEIIAGERCWFSGGVIGASKRITIGDHTLIGWGCTILDSSLHRVDNDSPEVDPRPVEIGSHVWMPSNITVFPGVKIGGHCVIGSGSLVTKNIPPNSFAAGSPAEVIREIGDRDRVE